MTGKVTVAIVSVFSLVEPPISQLEYEVRNGILQPIWLVNDDWLIWLQTRTHIELSYARRKMQSGSQVFGYFSPSVVKINPSDCISKKIQIVWPHTLDQLWNIERYASLPPGKYLVSVQVGYGLTPEPSLPEIGEGVEDPVFRWQKKVVSPEVQIEVPPHRQLSQNE